MNLVPRTSLLGLVVGLQGAHRSADLGRGIIPVCPPPTWVETELLTQLWEEQCHNEKGQDTSTQD